MLSGESAGILRSADFESAFRVIATAKPAPSRRSDALLFLLAKGKTLVHIRPQVSELDSIQSALARAAARRRWLRAWNGLWRGLCAGAVVWLIALAAFKLAPIPSAILPGAAALAGAQIGTVLVCECPAIPPAPGRVAKAPFFARQTGTVAAY